MKANVLLGQLKSKNKSVDWLIEQMKEEGVTVSKSTIYKKLRGESEFKATEIKVISKVMGYSQEQIIDIFFAELVS